MGTRIVLIAALGRRGELGRNNELLWRLPADLAHFKARTLGRPIVMGRKTYASIGRPLPGRRNIVISRNPTFTAPGCELAESPEAALRLAADTEELMVIGGAAIYTAFLPLADTLELTEVDGEFEADAFFPDIDRNAWQEIASDAHPADARNPYAYRYVTLVRKP